MDLTGTKILAMFILLLGTLTLGLIPIFFKRGAAQNGWRRKATSLLLCFGGGVLLATCFTHILPEVILCCSRFKYGSNLDRSSQVVESFNTFPELEEKPIGEILLCAGFFFVYLVEELVHYCSDHRMHPPHNDHQTAKVHR